MITVVHVIFGTAALAAAPAALLVRKGGLWHRRFGVAFSAAMSFVLFSAAFMWQEKGHLFLVPLAIVSGYLIINGFRVLARQKRASPSRFQDALDIGLSGVVILAGLGAAYLGIAAVTPLMLSIRPALIGVGTIAIAFGLNDILGFFGGRMRLGWLLSHFAAMIAAYISAVTAFVVINAHDVPMPLRWLIPSSIGAGMIVAYTLRQLGRQTGSTRYTAAISIPSTMVSVVAVLRNRFGKDTITSHESSSGLRGRNRPRT